MNEQGRVYVNFRIAGSLFFVVAISYVFHTELVNAMFVTALIYLVPSALIYIGGKLTGEN